MPPLVPCPTCLRHLRVDEGACPFCGAAVPAHLEDTLVPMPQRERGARVVLAPAVLVGLMVATFDCTAAVASKYGAPPLPPDGGIERAPITTAPVPAYGQPPHRDDPAMPATASSAPSTPAPPKPAPKH